MYANLVMSDVLFTFLVVLAIWLLTDIDGAPAAVRAGAAGTIVSLASAVRPLGAAIVVPAAIALALRRARLSAVAAFTAAALLFPLAWVVRNGVRTGVWALSSAFDYNLCLVAAAKVKAQAEGISRATAERVLVNEAMRSSPGADAAARVRAFRRVGYATLRRHPLTTLREIGASTLETGLAGERRNLLLLFGAGGGATVTLGEMTRSPRVALTELAESPPLERALVIGQAGWNAAVWVACALGVWRLARCRRGADLALYGLTVVAVLGPSLVVGTGRMRMPVSPMIAGLAAAGVWGLARRRDPARGAG